MSFQTFTPSGPEVVDMTKEKDWVQNLGMLDWDATQIMFTKRSLLEFLKYVGVSVDPNYTNIAKLPRYVKFGKLSANESDPQTSDVPSSEINDSNGLPGADAGAEDFRPSRRVRTEPGGQSSGIFEEEIIQPALLSAPPLEQDKVQDKVVPEGDVQAEGGNPSSYRPSRRVRTAPGGKDSLSGWWTDPPPEEFKPTRRVRDVPGGNDNLKGIL